MEICERHVTSQGLMVHNCVLIAEDTVLSILNVLLRYLSQGL